MIQIYKRDRIYIYRYFKYFLLKIKIDLKRIKDMFY